MIKTHTTPSMYGSRPQVGDPPIVQQQQQYGGERSAARSCSFTPAERAPGTPGIGGCVVPRIGLWAVEKLH
jgi:hypothetical protein